MTPLSYLAKTMPYRTIFARFWPCFERSLKQQLKIQDAQLFKKIKILFSPYIGVPVVLNITY
jgi:hypothetical protein